MTIPLFFYGSLRDPQILQAVLGRDAPDLTFVPAWAADCRIERAAGYSFPLLIPAPGDEAFGVLTHGLTPEDQARIAYFEDSEYELIRCNVRTGSGPAQAAVYAATNKLDTSGERWDFERFQREDRALLLAVTRHVMAEHYGVTPQSTMEQIWAAIRDRIAREMDLPIET